MKTSDAAISVCMELAYRAFINFRLLGSFLTSMEASISQIEEKEIRNIEEHSVRMKKYSIKQAEEYRIMMRCLLNDVGDEELDVKMSGIKELTEIWHSELLRQRVNTNDLVCDDIKLRMFEFIDSALKSVLNYCVSEMEEGAEKLYWEMDRAHNVPHEIYAHNKDRITKYGNFFNK
jgi:hypothetical protein